MMDHEGDGMGMELFDADLKAFAHFVDDSDFETRDQKQNKCDMGRDMVYVGSPLCSTGSSASASAYSDHEHQVGSTSSPEAAEVEDDGISTSTSSSVSMNSGSPPHTTSSNSPYIKTEYFPQFPSQISKARNYFSASNATPVSSSGAHDGNERSNSLQSIPGTESEKKCDESIPFARLELDEVFQILWKSRAGQFVDDVPKRPQASPISRDIPLFYVSPELKNCLSESEKDKLLGNPDNLVAVKYQGFPNGEIWWSKEHGKRRGLVARNMTRKSRNQKSDTTSHGFAGRWYTLLERNDASIQVTKTSCRAYVVHGAPSLVQFWPASEDDVKSRDTEKLRVAKLKKRKLMESTEAFSDLTNNFFDESKTNSLDQHQQMLERGQHDNFLPFEDDLFFDSVSDSFASLPQLLPTKGPSMPTSEHEYAFRAGPNNAAVSVARKQEETLVIKRSVHVQGDLTIDGDLTARSVRILGNLRLEGQLITSPHAADYAEWFPLLDPNEKIISGQVVQLRSPEQKITLDTSGAGPIMLVSTTPSVAAGVPSPEMHKEPGALCGFLGQLPALVRGPVQAGAHLFPSGSNDGLCVKGDTRHIDREPIGTAMESCGPGVHIINVFVRWAYNQSWQQKCMSTDRAGQVIATTWKLMFLAAAYQLLQVAYLAVHYKSRPLGFRHLLLLLELSQQGYAFVHFPVYPEFAMYGDVWGSIFLYLIDFIETGITFARNAGLLHEHGLSQRVEYVSLDEVRYFVWQCLAALLHMLVLVLITYQNFKCRQTLLSLAHESSATRDQWKRSIMKHMW